MKSMVLTGINRMEIIDKPLPEIRKPDEVLIKMASVGVCGSDIHYFTEGRIGSQVVSYPFTVGHEGAGIIVKTGTSVKNLKPGDRIAIDPAMPCFECDQCKAGRHHTCRKLKFLGCPGQAEGCLSEYLIMPASSCFKIADNMTLDEAALSEPLAIGVYATGLSVPLAGKKIGILGSGPIGISVLLPSVAIGAERIYMTDRIDARLKIASKMGAQYIANPDKTAIVSEILSLEGGGLDVVFECCGKQEAINQAIQLLKPGGQLMMIGIPSFDRWSFDVDDLRRKEINIQNVRRQNGSVEKTLDMIADGSLRPNLMQTHNFSFSRVAEAFDMVANYRDGVVKAMVHFGGWDE